MIEGVPDDQAWSERRAIVDAIDVATADETAAETADETAAEIDGTMAVTVAPLTRPAIT